MYKIIGNTIAAGLLMVVAILNSSLAYGQKTSTGKASTFQIDGAKHYQKMDGFGVNINTSWWLNGEYKSFDEVKPAIDLLKDELRATIFRAVIEEMDWETSNDNNDPNTFNWNYYDSVFSTPRFNEVWNALHYLNQKGIANNLIISFMGAPVASKPLIKADLQKSWMGDTTHIIHPDKEDEFVESIAALLYYARNKAKIQFSLVSPLNETDILSSSKNAGHPKGIVEGPNIPDAVQFTQIVGKLSSKLDAIGMEDIRLVTPDAGGDGLFRN